MLCLNIFGQIVNIFTPEWSARIAGPTRENRTTTLTVPTLDPGDQVVFRIGTCYRNISGDTYRQPHKILDILLPRLVRGSVITISIKGRTITLYALDPKTIRFEMDDQCSVQRRARPKVYHRQGGKLVPEGPDPSGPQ